MKVSANRFSLFHRLLLLGLIVTVHGTALAKIETVLGGVTLNRNPNLVATTPTTDEPEILISRRQYVISYNKNRRGPNWAAWKLETSDLGSAGRTNVFSQDIELDSYLQSTHATPAVTTTEYSGSCFDRGHQVPSADRTDSKTDNEATFFMSNILPQTAFLNRVVWEHLESYTRSLVRGQNKKVYVIAGPIYDEDFGAIGPNRDIPVPSKEFKVLMIMDEDLAPAGTNRSPQIIAVIMPNVQEDGSPVQPGHDCRPFTDVTSVDIHDWEKYQTSLSEVERLSGLKFALP